MMDAPTKLTNLQLELLKLFPYTTSETELNEIRSMLARYFGERTTREMDKLWDERGWTQETMQQWLNEDKSAWRKKRDMKPSLT